MKHDTPPRYGETGPGRRHHPMRVRRFKVSIGMGNGYTLYPLPPDDVPALADTLKLAIRHAEQRAYEAGRRDMQREILVKLGFLE